MNRKLFSLALSCKCPRCGEGALYPPGFNLTLKQSCDRCGLALADNDSADGPAVFLIFLLGFLLVPLALAVEEVFAPPLWFHAVFWGAISIILTLGMLRPLKAYVIALQYRHRPGDWK